MCDFVCFDDLCYDDFVGVVEELYSGVVGGLGLCFRVFVVDGGFLYVIVHDFKGGCVTVPLFFEEFGWDLVVEWVGVGSGVLVGGGDGVVDCFRFRGVFVSLFVFGSVVGEEFLRAFV